MVMQLRGGVSPGSAEAHLRKLVSTLRSGSGSGGPVASSVSASLQRAMLVGLLGWHLLMAAVVLVGDPRVPAPLMTVLHLALVGAAVASLRGRLRFDIYLTLGFSLWLIDYLAARSTDEALVLAACWLGNTLYTASALALTTRARTLLPIGGSAVVVTVLVLASPVWDLGTASTFVVTAVAIVVAARFAMPALWQLADDADASALRLEKERGTQEIIRRTSAESAEDARLLHDTVINTLGAIANGARGITQRTAVAERCRRDLQVVERMLSGRRTRFRDLTQIGRGDGTLQVHLVGIDETGLGEIHDMLTAEGTAALLGASDEALRNVAKHAGVHSATVEVVRADDTISIIVIDQGRGFDIDGVTGTGISESIVGRLEQVGGDVVIQSRLGSGTRVQLTCPLVGQAVSSAAPASTDPQVGSTAQRLILRACWLMSLSVVMVGVVIEAGNRPGELTWTYAMLAVVGVCLGLSYVAFQRWGTLPKPVIWTLVLALPVGFLASMAGIDFGRTEVIYYQAIGIVPLMMILLATGALRSAAVAAALLTATAVGLAATMWTQSPDYGTVVIVGAAPAVALTLGWYYFQQLVVRIVAEAEATRLLAERASVDAAAQQEIAEARRGWGTAGLKRSADLLRGIADGGLDVGSATVQHACATEEEYLRRLLLLSSSAYRISVWFAQALNLARSRDVHLVIRAGDEDAPDRASASAVGNLLLDTVADAPAGETVTVGWFQASSAARLIIVSPAAGATEDRQEHPTLPAAWDVTRTTLGGQEMLEVVVR